MTSKHKIIRIIQNMKIFIQCYPVYSFWTLGCNAISWRAVKTHILKTWRHAKCTTFDIYEIVSWTRTRYQGCRKSFWYDADFAANEKLVQKKKNIFNFKLKICYRTKKKKKYETTEHQIFEISCFDSVWMLIWFDNFTLTCITKQNDGPPLQSENIRIRISNNVSLSFFIVFVFDFI